MESGKLKEATSNDLLSGLLNELRALSAESEGVGLHKDIIEQ